MLEYWMASNETGHNGSDEAIEGALQNPGSAVLFVGYPRWLLHFAAGCCILFMLVGIPGNLITILALFRSKKLRNATAVFIMNLSISDLMFCCFNLPLSTSTFWHSSWRHGALLCRLFPLLRYGLVAVSLFTILTITINRYIMIGHPRLYPTLYKTKYLIPMVLGTWVVAFSVLIITWFEKWGRFGLDPAIGSCSILPDVNGRSPKEFLFVVAFLIPCVAIVVCYARIFYIVRKTASRSRRRNVVTNAEEGSREGRSATPRIQEEGEEKPDEEEEDEELEERVSVSSSNCAMIVLCASLAPKVWRKQAPRDDSTPRSNRKQDSRSRSRSTDEALSPMYRSTQQSPCEDGEEEKIEDEDESVDQREEENPKKRSGDLDRESQDSSKNPEIMDERDVIKIGFEVGTDDIPFVDEREDSSVREIDVFPGGQGERKESVEKPSANARNKLERMASRASFMVESALWVQRVSAAGNDRFDRAEALVGSGGNSSERGKKRTKVSRRESMFRGIGRPRNSVTPPRMSNKDKKLLKMILVIFASFLICYLPITVTKIFKDAIDWRGLNIAGYILIYLTTCINPIIYVVMSSEYRSAYKNALLCRSDSSATSKPRKPYG